MLTLTSRTHSQPCCCRCRYRLGRGWNQFTPVRIASPTRHLHTRSNAKGAEVPLPRGRGPSMVPKCRVAGLPREVPEPGWKPVGPDLCLGECKVRLTSVWGLRPESRGCGLGAEAKSSWTQPRSGLSRANLARQAVASKAVAMPEGERVCFRDTGLSRSWRGEPEDPEEGNWQIGQ